VNAKIYIEGGGDSKELHARCREGFRRLFERCGFSGRMPRLVACGGRSATFDDFKIAQQSSGKSDYIAMLIDSEDVMSDIDKTWEHLKRRDNWDRPHDAGDDQVLLMVTCMETWIIADRGSLQGHYGANLQKNALPPTADLQSKDRHFIQDALVHATRNCKNAYRKGKRSFEVVGKLNPAELRRHLSSFARCERILNEKL
jgi:hypothetical protein